MARRLRSPCEAVAWLCVGFWARVKGHEGQYDTINHTSARVWLWPPQLAKTRAETRGKAPRENLDGGLRICPANLRVEQVFIRAV